MAAAPFFRFLGGAASGRIRVAMATDMVVNPLLIDLTTLPSAMPKLTSSITTAVPVIVLAAPAGFATGWRAASR